MKKHIHWITSNIWPLTKYLRINMKTNKATCYHRNGGKAEYTWSQGEIRYYMSDFGGKIVLKRAPNLSHRKVKKAPGIKT